MATTSLPKEHLRVVMPAPRPQSAPHRVLLTMRPTKEPATYAVRSEWAEFVAGSTHHTILEKNVALRVEPHENRWRLYLRGRHA